MPWPGPKPPPESLPCDHRPEVAAERVASRSVLTAQPARMTRTSRAGLPEAACAHNASAFVAYRLSSWSCSSWQGPNFGVRIHWDPAVWSVEGESIEEGYDGLQIGTPISTVFLEAYD